MSKQTAESFFIVSPSETKSAELYQALLRGIGSYQQLGQRLIRLAEQAHAFQQFDKVREMGLMLSNLPIKHYHAIGIYYLAVAANSRGNGDQDEARKLFETVIDTAPDTYKIRGVLSLGALSYNKRDFDSALHYYRETIKTGRLNIASLIATRGIATVKSIAGDHTQAVKDLESILPIIKYAPPHIYFDLLNSYAVELGEVGRKDEARNIMRVVLASPHAFAYPEWRETAQELKPANRSFIAINPLTGRNVLRFKPTDRTEETEASTAKVLTFMAKKDKTKADEPEPKMTKAERAKWLRLRILSDEFPEDLLNEMIRLVIEHDEK